MSAEKNKKKSKLSTVYRFAVIEDESHKNLFAFRGSKIGVIISISVIIIVIIISAYALIAYTPIRKLIPGYPSSETQRAAVENAAKIDSLENEIAMWSFQLENIQRIITGKEPINVDSLIRHYSQEVASSAFDGKRTISKEDSILREEVTRQELFDLSSSRTGKISQIEGLLFFPPVKGIVTDSYNKATGHPYIDIAVPANSIVSATLDGTIISAAWSDETGYTIQIQHDNDLISVYKHNVKLLKKTGDHVKAGTPISMAGDAGSLSTGSHLHFELWYKGEPVNPTQFIKF